MRTNSMLFALAALAATAGCDAASDDLTGDDAADIAGDKAGPDEIELKHDLRPVDGDLSVLKLVRNGKTKTYNATLRTAFFDRLAGKEVDTTETLATDLACTFGDQVLCSRDLRPVDGALTELSVVEGELSNYDVILRTVAFDRFTGKEVETVETVASSLGVVAEPIVFSRDDRPVDGALVEVRIVKTRLATHDVELHTVVFDRFAGAEVEDTQSLGIDLDCVVSATSVVCSRDDRPVDGVLTVVNVAKTKAGSFNATLRTAFFDRLAGKMIDHTDTVATGLAR